MTTSDKQIRNFCVIAHIDHGKSTLADRLLEITQTVAPRKMREQFLDSMDLEREKGITIKLQPVRMRYQGNTLNLIDTPGHVDFQYEVSRSLSSVEGVILLVDATQGVQAQTITNLSLAQAANLTIIPVINKVDLPAAAVPEVTRQIHDLIPDKPTIYTISAKTGQGVKQVLQAIITKIPPASTDTQKPFQALIFDSTYDEYKGVIAYVRVVAGTIKQHDTIYLPGTNQQDSCLEAGIMTPSWQPTNSLSAGEIGYIATGFKDVRQARVGDTVVLATDKNKVKALPGFTLPQPKLFAGLYPTEGDQFPALREAIEKLELNDASLQTQVEQNEALGRGFRCGFLGMLHLEITRERLKREWGINLVVTTPSVLYRIITSDGRQLAVKTSADWPDPSSITKVLERLVEAEVIVPTPYLGPVFKLLRQSEGEPRGQEHLGNQRVRLKYKIPLRALVVDLYDLLKSATAGYGSISYALGQWRQADVVKLKLLINREEVAALSVIVRRQNAALVGRRLVEKLKKLLPRQQFALPLQAAVGGNILARETLPALRKDVTAKLYGGDYSRKKKLLTKQKKGKKKMSAQGKVQIPSSVYIDLLKK